MILWVALFLLVVAISFVLAFQSMRDYSEIPGSSAVEYGLFLIRSKDNFTSSLLDSLHQEISKQGLIISIERLFKGVQSVLVVFGPKSICQDYAVVLNLLELEDYTAVDAGSVSLWEMALKNSTASFFKNLSLLSKDEQFWWQLILLPTKAQKGRAKYFQSQIRAAVFCVDKSKRESLVDSIQSLAPEQFIKKPVPFSNDQILEFYRQRSLIKNPSNQSLASAEVLQLSQL